MKPLEGVSYLRQPASVQSGRHLRETKAPNIRVMQEGLVPVIRPGVGPQDAAGVARVGHNRGFGASPGSASRSTTLTERMEISLRTHCAGG